jgi:hypothetical protein
MDVESRIRELKRELEYLESQRGAKQTDEMGLEPLPPPRRDNQWPHDGYETLGKNMPYQNPAPRPAAPPAPYMQNMPYKLPASRSARPNQYMKKL